MGRFISADTIVPEPQNPQDLNRYSYVRNSPLNYQDPSGHAADPGGGAGLTVEDLHEIYNRLADETDPAAWYGHQQMYYATKAVLYGVLSEGVSPESQLVKDKAAIVQSKYIALANNGFYGAGPALRSAYMSAGGESAVAIPLMTGLMALTAGGVDPNHHNANVTVRDAEGHIIHRERIVSGNMSPEEKALPFPQNTLASHTEARAVRQIGLQVDQSMAITGQLPPCPSCKGAMSRASLETGATIVYRWRENGITQRWTANSR